MKNRTIAKILNVWGYVILFIGTIVPLIFCILTWKSLTPISLLVAIFMIFSSLIGSCGFLALARILSMVNDLYRMNLDTNKTKQTDEMRKSITVEPSHQTYNGLGSSVRPISPQTAKTCEKCGKILDENYAREWRYCEECRAKYFK